MGHEFCGTVCEVGDGVARFAAGESLTLAEWEEAFRRFEAREGLKVLVRPE